MKKTYYTIIAAGLCSLFFAQQNAFELKGAKVDYISTTTKLPLQVSFDDDNRIPESQFIDWMKKEMISSEAVSFLPTKTEYDALGLKHSRYQQYFNGYKIENSLIIAHSKNNEVKSFNGEWYKNITISNAISISEQQALSLALKKVNAKKYKWENLEEEAHMQQALNNPNFSFKPTRELVILTDIENTNAITYTYAYKFSIYAEEPLYKANVYVNAANGKIIKEQNLICTIDALGTANTKYSGTKPITTDSYTGGYRLRESGRGQGIETYNLNNGTSYGNATDFTNGTNSWTAITNNQAATDAHFGAEATYDYYYQLFNRNSIDNNGFKLLSYVHYSNDYANAFWDGARMTYGDGKASQGYSIMTALDICGHEITHGVIENTAGLSGGEADALNEGFSDIFGTAIEWHARPTQRDWLLGYDISTAGNAIRNLANPKSLGQPDTYQGQYWDAAGEEHTNDGPCIYWFYLLSVGGNGVNDNNQTYNVAPITMAKAQAIAYRALTVYMTPGTNYASVRNYCIQAAKDLYGACSNEVKQTTNAWYAVGVGSQYVAGAVGASFAATQLKSCSLPTTINFINNTADGSSYIWSFGDNTSSTIINPSHTYTLNGTYSVKLVAKGCTVGLKDSVIKSSYITINAPTNPVTSNVTICSGGSASLTATGNGAINWYNTSIGGTSIGNGNAFNTPNLTNSTTYYAVNTTTQTSMYGGPASNAVFGGGTNFNSNAIRHLIFDVLQPCKLKTVKVVANSAGNRTIELRNSAGTVLQSANVFIPAGTQVVTLNFNLTPGTNYQLGTSTLPDMWRNNTNTGASFPFNIGGLVNITTTDAGSAFYYYFYNWEVQQNNCQSGRVPATAQVNVCAGLNEEYAEGILSMYPNPTNAKLTVNLTEELASTTKSIEVYDALGKIVKVVPISATETLINVSDLATGVYTCRFVTTSNKTIVKRFVKE